MIRSGWRMKLNHGRAACGFGACASLQGSMSSMLPILDMAVVADAIGCRAAIRLSTLAAVWRESSSLNPLSPRISRCCRATCSTSSSTKRTSGNGSANEFDRRFYYIDKALQRLAPIQDKEARVEDTNFIEQTNRKIIEMRRQYFTGPSEEDWALGFYYRLLQRSPGVSPEALFNQDQVEERVNDLKAWWSAHRNDVANLPTATPPPVPSLPPVTP